MVFSALDFEDEVTEIVDHLLNRYDGVAGILHLVSEVDGVYVPLYSFNMLLSYLDGVVERVPCENLRWLATMRFQDGHLVELPVVRFDLEAIFSTISGVASLGGVDVEGEVLLSEGGVDVGEQLLHEILMLLENLYA